MPPPELLTWLQSGGVLGVLLLLGWAFYKRKIRLASDVDELLGIERERREEMRQQRDFYKMIASQGVDAMNRSLDLIEAGRESRADEADRVARRTPRIQKP